MASEVDHGLYISATFWVLIVTADHTQSLNPPNIPINTAVITVSPKSKAKRNHTTEDA